MGIRSELVAAALALNRQVDAETIIYRRGAASVEITDAIPLGGARPQDRDEGAFLQFDELDWGLRRAALVLDGDPAIPQKGDIIDRVIGTNTLTYTVLPRDTTAPWRWSDRGQTQYRVFTKLHATTPVS
jgi:hypothetical protein